MRAEKLASKGGNCAFQIGKGNPFTNNQSFHLQELDLASGADGLIAVTHTGQDGTNWLACRSPHHMDLSGAGVCPKQHTGDSCEESIPHVAGRMVGRHI